MSNKLIYRFVTGEVMIIDLSELVVRGELTPGAAVKFEVEISAMNDEDKKAERRETRYHLSLEKMIDKFVPLEKLAEHRPLTPEDAVLQAEMVDLLCKAMDSCLTETQRRRFIDYHGNGKSFRQIADAAGVNEISARQSVRAAMSKLKKYFGKI